MVWGWQWKILLLLGLKIAYGRTIRNLTHQEGGLGTEQQGQVSTPRGQAVQLGLRWDPASLSVSIPHPHQCRPQD